PDPRFLLFEPSLFPSSSFNNTVFSTLYHYDLSTIPKTLPLYLCYSGFETQQSRHSFHIYSYYPFKLPYLIRIHIRTSVYWVCLHGELTDIQVDLNPSASNPWRKEPSVAKWTFHSLVCICLEPCL